MTEDVETETIELTFDLPASPLLKRGAVVLLLALDAPPRGKNLAVTFSSQSLQPDVQVTSQLVPPVFCSCRRLIGRCFLSVCVHLSGDELRASNGKTECFELEDFRCCRIPTQKYDARQSKHIKSRLDSQCFTLSFLAEQTLMDILIGEHPGSRITGAALLLRPGGSAATGRSSALNSNFPHTAFRIIKASAVPPLNRSAGGSSHTAAFLCELRRFLGDFMPQDRRQSFPLRLTSLQSLPAVAIGASSSEALLATLINSSTLTVFSFAGCCSSQAPVRGGELSLSSALLEELRQRLAAAVAHSLEVMRQEEVGARAVERLGRLVDLSEELKRDPPAKGDDG